MRYEPERMCAKKSRPIRPADSRVNGTCNETMSERAASSRRSSNSLGPRDGFRFLGKVGVVAKNLHADGPCKSSHGTARRPEPDQSPSPPRQLHPEGAFPEALAKTTLMSFKIARQSQRETKGSAQPRCRALAPVAATTTMPSSSAARTSILSVPVPARATTSSRGAPRRSERVNAVRLRTTSAACSCDKRCEHIRILPRRGHVSDGEARAQGLEPPTPDVLGDRDVDRCDRIHLGLVGIRHGHLQPQEGGGLAGGTSDRWLS